MLGKHNFKLFTVYTF